MTSDNTQHFDVTAIDRILAERGTDSSAVIPILQDIQQLHGYLPPPALEYVVKHSSLTASQIMSVATFYAQFRLKPVGKHVLKVCHGTACHVRGAERIELATRESLHIAAGHDTSPDNFATLERVACLGCCSLAPVVMAGEDTWARLTGAKVRRHVKDLQAGKKRAAPPPPSAEAAAGNGKAAKHLHASLGAQAKIIVGMGSCGKAAGSERVYENITRGISETGLPVTVATVGCVGMCFSEPNVTVLAEDGSEYFYGSVDAGKIATELIEGHLVNGVPVQKWLIRGPQGFVNGGGAYLKGQVRIALANVGRVDPERLDSYLGLGGYRMLAEVLKSYSPERVIEEITKSGLRGRGGAGFPTGVKWKFTREAPDAKRYIICNGDEGDPGAFMDRSVLEGDPHSVLEGMVIGAYAIGANNGYLYIRAEYPLAVKNIRRAIVEAEKAGYLGDNILGTGFALHLKVKEGAGAFVCGEETALMASIEGRRGMPRIRPPFPAQSGLWGHPTCINNVETFANVPRILEMGADQYAALGTPKSKGTKVFALAGDVKRGGLVEVPMGMTLHQVIHEIGGGPVGTKPVKAVQLGGPSGGCIPAALFDTPVDYDAITATGAIMGSGGMVVMDEGACMVDVALFFLKFTQDESCGKCTFCRLGTLRMMEILERITQGQGRPEDIAELESLAKNIKAASLCGLGQTAPNPVLTTLRYFRHEYEAHIAKQECPAKRCKALIRHYIDLEPCTGCDACRKNCPTEAITGTLKQKNYVILKDKCIQCGMCVEACRFDAVLVQ